MSQQLTPIDGGVQQIQTTTATNRFNIFSPQYVQAKGLEKRPTEWVPGGRPIYRRLPAASETYQVDFFNVVSPPNTAVATVNQNVGYVFTPWDASTYGAGTLEVTYSEDNSCILVNSGKIVWKYGTTEVLPTIINLRVLDVLSGEYQLSYQLLYDDSPLQKLYSVEDFSLTGQPLNIVSSTDNVIGWRFPAVNAFLDSGTNWWSNTDSFLPSYAQPVESYIQWETELPAAYSKIILRCPSNTAYTVSATLEYVTSTGNVAVATSSILTDSTGQYYQFDIVSPTFQTGWNVNFSGLNVSIQSIHVTGVITQMQQQSEPSTRAVLVMYPKGFAPTFVQNSSGNTVEATYCNLAVIEVSDDYQVLKVKDDRYIIHREYVPIADWLTLPFDQDLINLYEQIIDYSNLWIAPPTCMVQEYLTLSEDQINVTV